MMIYWYSIISNKSLLWINIIHVYASVKVALGYIYTYLYILYIFIYLLQQFS